MPTEQPYRAVKLQTNKIAKMLCSIFRNHPKDIPCQLLGHLDYFLKLDPKLVFKKNLEKKAYIFTEGYFQLFYYYKMHCKILKIRLKVIFVKITIKLVKFYQFVHF